MKPIDLKDLPAIEQAVDDSPGMTTLLGQVDAFIEDAIRSVDPEWIHNPAARAQALTYLLSVIKQNCE